jgi:type IV pilus assembly protein PilY1
VIGFGADMPVELKNTLNWAAYFGGTSNPYEDQTGDISAIAPSTDPCNEGNSNDPGDASLTGYAFLATDASALSDALIRAFDFINNSRLSFTASSVAAFRTTAENYLYEASFQPVNGDPFWIGHLIKYNINSDGTVGSQIWDAGTLLQEQAASSRNMFTYMSGALTTFTISNFSTSTARAKLGSTITSTQAQAIIGYIRGESTYNHDDWKLGDIFHSNPVVIGSPSPYFTDIHSPQAFADFRSTNASRERMIVSGANDGQFRAFDSGNGSERWSFIPPNVLPKLQYIAHSTEPTTLTHKYMVDGPVIVADVWLGSGDGTSKSASDWHTYLVFGEGKGVRDSTNTNPSFLWSSSSSCDTGFSKTYSSTYSNYCGYYAFEVTDTALSTPVFKWRLNFTGTPSSAQTQAYLGEPWSKMAVGRVKISGNEKWVGFVSGGCYWSSSTSYCSSSSGNPGKGFYVVDLSDGHVLWSFTKGSSTTSITSTSMTYSLPASPAIVDTDNDGFIDTVYAGDFGGNMWRFKFCRHTDTSCDTGSWAGGLLFQASSGRPIYTSAAVARDSSSLWVFWGTGDKEAPLGTSGTDKFFGIKDNDRTTTYTISQLQDISTAGTTYSDTSKKGWYITLAGTGEKVLADPTVFGGIVMFTTYTPTTSSSDPCARIGTAKLYAIAMMPVTIGNYRYDPGAGVLSTPGSPSSTAGGNRSVTLGTGMAKEPVVSQKPAPGGATDLYISVSGGIGESTSIVSSAQLGSTPLTDRLQTTSPSNQVLHWRDGRMQ